MQPLHRAHLQVKTDLSALDQVREWFDHQARRDPVPEIVWMKCELALAEGFTNAVRYAHKGDSTALIDMEVVLFSEWMEIRIWDFGSPFNIYLELRHKLLKELLDRRDSNEFDLSEGGRGIKLMWKIADLLRYTRASDDRNCLLILKHYTLDP